MRILHTVHFYHPAIGGSEEVVRQISEQLVRRGHHVTVATGYHPQRKQTIINGVRIEPFRISGNRATGIQGTTDEIHRYEQMLLECGADVIMNYAAQSWSTDLTLPLLDKIPARKILAPCGYSYLHHRVYRNYYAELPNFLRKYDACIYHSHQTQDKLLADRVGLTNSVVIPNAASKEEFISAAAPDFKARYHLSKRLLLTVCNHYRSKGHWAVIRAYIHSRTPATALAIIGERVPGGCGHLCWLCAKASRMLRGKRIVMFEGVPREYVIAAFKQAELFVFGSRIECSPLVLIEAMAAKLPFISMPCGNSAELAEWGGGVIVKSSMGMAAEIDRLLADQSLRGAIARRGFTIWQERLTWESAVDLYERTYATR